MTCTDCEHRRAHAVEILRPDPDGDRPVVSTISAPITPEHLAIASGWTAALQQHGAPDAAWDWRAHVRETTIVESEGCALAVDGDLQGLMIIAWAGHRSRDRSGKGLIYVEYLAVAPQNRRAMRNPTRYKHCGLALLAYARHRSDVLGFRGRLGLHSLADPHTEAFYRRIGMRDFGPDSAENNLRYFEFGLSRV